MSMIIAFISSFFLFCLKNSGDASLLIDSYSVQSKLTAASTKFLSKQNPLCARQRRRIRREYRTALESPIPTRCHRLAAKGLSKPVPIDTGTIVRTQWNDCHFHPQPRSTTARRLKRPRHLTKRRFLSIFLFARMWTTVPRCTTMERNLRGIQLAPSFPSIFRPLVHTYTHTYIQFCSLSPSIRPSSTPHETVRNAIVESRLLTRGLEPLRNDKFFQTKPGQQEITHKVRWFFHLPQQHKINFFPIDYGGR